MRRLLLGLLAALGFSSWATEARAQVGVLNDPFFAYYSFYLPRQQAQALQPGPEATLNAVTANRQHYAATNRNGMFDPNGSGGDLFDFGTGEFSPNSGANRRSLSTVGGRYGVHGGNLNGLGPAGFYNSKLSPYYRDLRTGRGKNNNVAVLRGRAGNFSGGFGGGIGLPGPR